MEDYRTLIAVEDYLAISHWLSIYIGIAIYTC